MKRIITLLITGLGLAALCAAQEQDTTQFGVFRQEGIASFYGNEFAGRPTASGELFDPNQLTAAHPTLPFGTMLRITNKNNNRQVVVRVNDRGPFVSARFLDVSQGAAEQLGMISTGTAPVIAESLGQVALTSPAQAAPTTPVPVPSPATPAAPPASPDKQPAPNYQVSPVQTSPAPNPAPGVPAQPPAPQAAPAPAYQPPQAPAAAAPAAAPSPQAPAPLPAYQPPPPPLTALPPADILPSMPPLGTNKTYRVQVGSFKVPRHAADAIEKLKSVGLNPAYERNGEYYRVVIAGIKPEEIQAMAEKLGMAGFREALVREER